MHQDDAETQLISAVKTGDHLMAKRALREGADPDTCMSYTFPEHWGGECNRVPVLTVAATLGHVDVVSVLLKANVNTEYRGNFTITPLSKAIAEGHLIIVEKLLNNKADVSERSSQYGWLPIHYAAKYGHMRIAQMLQSRRSSLDALNDVEGTPLHLAARNGKCLMVEWLMAKHVDVAATDIFGKTAADYADSCNHMELALYLRSHEDDSAPTSTTQIQKKEVQIQKKEVFIMNYIDFIGKPEQKRNGASEDSKNLRSTFEQLGYKVNLRENMDQLETNNFLDAIQQDTHLEFILLIILSHGKDEDTFMTSDWTEHSLTEIQYRFTDNQCPQLEGKDKIILCCFCRGGLEERLIPDLIYSIPRADQRIPTGEQPPHQMITINCSHEGFVAWRHRTKGTLFIQNLCDVLKEEQNLTIQNVFNRLYNNMKRDKGTTPEMKVSAPMPSFTF